MYRPDLKMPDLPGPPDTAVDGHHTLLEDPRVEAAHDVHSDGLRESKIEVFGGRPEEEHLIQGLPRPPIFPGHVTDDPRGPPLPFGHHPTLAHSPQPDGHSPSLGHPSALSQHLPLAHHPAVGLHAGSDDAHPSAILAAPLFGQPPPGDNGLSPHTKAPLEWNATWTELQQPSSPPMGEESPLPQVEEGAKVKGKRKPREPVEEPVLTPEELAAEANLIAMVQEKMGADFRSDGPALSMYFDVTPGKGFGSGRGGRGGRGGGRGRGRGGGEGAAGHTGGRRSKITPGGRGKGAAVQPAELAEGDEALLAAEDEVLLEEVKPPAGGRGGRGRGRGPSQAAAEKLAVKEAKRKRMEEAREEKIREEMDKRNRREQEKLQKKEQLEQQKLSEKREKEQRKEQERLRREEEKEQERLQREAARRAEREERERAKEAEKAEKQRLRQEARAAREEERMRLQAERDKARQRAREEAQAGLPDDLYLEEEELRMQMELTERNEGLHPDEDNSDEEMRAEQQIVLPDFPPEELRLTEAKLGNLEPEGFGLLLLVHDFLHNFGGLYGISPCTMGQLRRALADGTHSQVLADMHVSLLKGWMFDAEEAFRVASNMAVQQERTGIAALLDEAWAWGFDPDAWRAHLNVLTWPEVLRQMCVSAGYGTARPKTHSGKKWRMRRQIGGPNGAAGSVMHPDEDIGAGVPPNSALRIPSRFAPGTVKAAAWQVLSKAGATGMTIPKIAERIQREGLRDLRTSKTPEASVATALGRDLVFYRVKPSTYCLRSLYIAAVGDPDVNLPQPSGMVYKELHRAELSARAAQAAKERALVSSSTFRGGVGAPGGGGSGRGEAGGMEKKGRDRSAGGGETNGVDGEEDGEEGRKRREEDGEEGAGGESEEDEDEDDEDDDDDSRRQKKEPESVSPQESWVKSFADEDYNQLSLLDRLRALEAVINGVMEGQTLRNRLDERIAATEQLKLELRREAVEHRKQLKEQMQQALVAAALVADGEADGSPGASVEDPAVQERKRKERHEDVRRQMDEDNPIRTNPIGADRRYNRYFRFKGEVEADEAGAWSATLLVERSDGGRWQSVTTAEQLDALQGCLNPKGVRENHLQRALQRTAPEQLEIIGSLPSVDPMACSPACSYPPPPQCIAKPAPKQAPKFPLKKRGRVAPQLPGVVAETDDAALSPQARASLEAVKYAAALLLKSPDALPREDALRWRAGDDVVRCSWCQEAVRPLEDQHCIYSHQTFSKGSVSLQHWENHTRKAEAAAVAAALEKGIQLVDDGTGETRVLPPPPPHMQKLKALMLDIETVLPARAVGPKDWNRKEWSRGVKLAENVADLRDLEQTLERVLAAESVHESFSRGPVAGSEGDIAAVVPCLEKVADGGSGKATLKLEAQTVHAAPPPGAPWAPGGLPATTAAVALRLLALDAAIFYQERERCLRERAEEYQYSQPPVPLDGWVKSAREALGVHGFAKRAPGDEEEEAEEEMEEEEVEMEVEEGEEVDGGEEEEEEEAYIPPSRAMRKGRSRTGGRSGRRGGGGAGSVGGLRGRRTGQHVAEEDGAMRTPVGTKSRTRETYSSASSDEEGELPRCR
ncbi:hypothetical protein CYMTET_20286 [Cymbomonas tetramitiformis]|uniref:DDT domain-containing protein n=1 Tax=Cymbomonas tetramitiformis TaxID=36881 RepID=A0AAE0G4E0_9CHLO|nr:hypothetical protein CYMTET_20286 [Cymbomonas tetramitiformis]